MNQSDKELSEALALTKKLRDLLKGNPWEVHLIRSLSSVQTELERQLKGGT